MTKQQMMRDAHQLAKTFEGHYHARLALAMRIIWKKAKALTTNIGVRVKQWFASYKNMTDTKETLIIDDVEYNATQWEILKESANALLLTYNGSKQFWVPRNQCHI